MSRATFAVCVFLVASSFAFAQGEKKAKEVDPSGTWRWEYDMQGETIKDWLVLQKQKDGKVTGKLHSSSREEPLDIKAKIEGDKLTMETSAEFNGTLVDLVFSGKIKGDELDGEVVADAEGQTFEFPWTPERSVKLDDVLGTWDLVIETPESDLEAKFVVSKEGDKEFKGVHSGDGIGDVPAKDLKVKKNKLAYTIETEFDGGDLVATLSGRPYGNTIKGMVDVDLNGETYELPFAGKRRVEKKDAKKRD